MKKIWIHAMATRNIAQIEKDLRERKADLKRKHTLILVGSEVEMLPEPSTKKFKFLDSIRWEGQESNTVGLDPDSKELDIGADSDGLLKVQMGHNLLETAKGLVVTSSGPPGFK